MVHFQIGRLRQETRRLDLVTSFCFTISDTKVNTAPARTATQQLILILFYPGLVVFDPRSDKRTMPGGRVSKDDLPKGENGRALCRWCSLEVPRGRQTFCSDWCVGEWRLRTNPGYLRERTFHRDRGVCANCAVDTVAAWIQLKRSRGSARARLLAHWGLNRLNRRSLWDADHLAPVVDVRLAEADFPIVIRWNFLERCFGLMYDSAISRQRGFVNATPLLAINRHWAATT